MGRTRVASAIGLAVLMALSTIGAPATAQEAAADPRQPSPDNPHMHIYGNDDLSNCFSHFDGNDTSGSAPDGYGEKEWPNQNGQQIEMDYTCRMESFKQDMHLNENGTIRITLNFLIDADGDCSTANAKCENMNLTLYKGGFQVARQEFPAVDRSGNEDTVIWEIPIDKNMTRFNRSEEPQIQVEFSFPGYDNIFPCSLGFYCGGSFRMYYHTPGNDSAEVNFPVVNQSMPGEGGEEEPGLIGGVTDSLPGFGLMAGVGSLAMAAVAASRLSREE